MICVGMLVCSLYNAMNWTVGLDDGNDSSQSSAMTHVDYIVQTIHTACNGDNSMYR